jgi:hypothetical protein
MLYGVEYVTAANIDVILIVMKHQYKLEMDNYKSLLSLPL